MGDEAWEFGGCKSVCRSTPDSSSATCGCAGVVIATRGVRATARIVGVLVCVMRGWERPGLWRSWGESGYFHKMDHWGVCILQTGKGGTQVDEVGCKPAGFWGRLLKALEPDAIRMRHMTLRC